MTDHEQSRAADPGVRLSQVPGPTWVHCPDCREAARLSRGGVVCTKCEFRTIPTEYPDLYRWAKIRQDEPRCVHCRHPLPRDTMPTGRMEGDEHMLRAKCPTCGKSEDYRATIGFPPEGATRHWPDTYPKFLTAQVGGETLWVDNLAHLTLLEGYLGAKVRERGPVAGLTMMARLPAWMKAASMRPKVVRALAQLRERAERAGINE